jgi:tRNA (cmo5U34)-methyltransferase
MVSDAGARTRGILRDTGTVMADAVRIFAEHAREYDVLRRRLVPGLDALYGTAADLLALRGDPVRRVLDLGAGTGLLSAFVAERHPEAELVLVDGAAPMLAQAQRLLAARKITVVVADLRDALPDGPFDAVVSALAIHHLDDEAKRDLNLRVREALRPGGVFVNAEQVRGPTAWLDAGQREAWLAACRREGAGERELAQTLERMRADRPVDTETQLGWLRSAGFVDVDCFYKRWHFAVIAGWRPLAADGPGEA